MDNQNMKEILDGLNVVIKQEGSLEFDFKECKKILDYITNLQEELKSANESITWYSNRFKAVERDNRKLKEENENLKENNKKKTSRCTERNHRIRGCQRVIERRNKKISKLEKELDYANNDNIYYIAKIDKAINYINTWLVDEYSIAVPSKEKPDVFCEYEPNAKEKLLNILGGDEE